MRKLQHINDFDLQEVIFRQASQLGTSLNLPLLVMTRNQEQPPSLPVIPSHEALSQTRANEIRVQLPTNQPCLCLYSPWQKMGNTHTLINKTHDHVETKWSIFFVKASDGYTAFTTLFHPDASFAMAPRVLHLRNPSTLDAPPALRSKSGTLPARWF